MDSNNEFIPLACRTWYSNAQCRQGTDGDTVNLNAMTAPLENLQQPKIPMLGDTLLLLGGVCGVGAAALLARLALDGGMSALSLATWRLTLAGSVLLGWQALTYSRANAPALPSSTKWRLAIAGACLALHFVAWFASLQLIPIARSTLLVTTAPLWAGLLGLVVPALKPRRGFWTGLSVAAVGLFLVTMYGAQRSGIGAFSSGRVGQGEAYAIIGAIAVVPYMLLVQKVQAEYGTLRAVTWTYISAALCLWLVALPQGQTALPSTAKAWLGASGMAVFSQLLGHTALNRSLRHFTAAQVSAVTLLEPVIAGALAWLLLNERVTVAQGAGALLVLGGVAITMRAGDRSQSTKESNHDETIGARRA